VTDRQQGGEGTSVVDRLRQRKVVQWGVAYVAGAWGLLQGIGFTADAFSWPAASKRIALLLLLVGLPIALVLAWYHGDRGEQRVGRVELAILTVLFLLGGGLFWRYQHASWPAAVIPSTSTATSVAIPTDHSIAVLPFVDMSQAHDQEYFSDGISEELLNLLAQVPQLRVIARTSSFSFKGKEVDVATIARTLNVANVLEGSVRKSGDTLRITAQLVRASDSSHLWSQTYDRQLTDVFKVQDEIAAAVVAQLKLQLFGAAPKATVADPKAYALYLQARQLSRQSTQEGSEQAVLLYQQALALDANSAAAWTGLAEVYEQQAGLGQRPVEAGYRLAREAANKALAIDPNFAPAYAELGRIAMYYDGDLATAARHYQHALALEPADTGIIRSAAILLAGLGRLDTAIALEEYLVARDPVSPTSHFNVGYHYLSAGRLDEAIASYRSALRLSPGYDGAQGQIGVASLVKGDPAAALTAMQKESFEVVRTIGLPMAWHALGEKAKSDEGLAELIRKHGKDAPYNIAYVLAFRGEADRAFEWLDKAVAYNDPGLYEVVGEPLFANIHGDPRWEPFLRKIGKAPEQLSAIKFDVKVPR
jgi:TolB-like protein/Tfp pilus assembly protein PilF